MRKSRKNNSRLSRFVHYKYSGPIVFVPIIFLIAMPFAYYYATAEFFDKWNCSTIDSYLSGLPAPNDIPNLEDLSDTQLTKLETFDDECKSITK